MSKRNGTSDLKKSALIPRSDESGHQRAIACDPEDVRNWVRLVDLSEKIGFSIRDTLLQVGESYLYVRLTHAEGRIASGWFQLDQECFYHLLFRCHPLDANSEFSTYMLTNFGDLLPEGAVGQRIKEHPLLEKTWSRADQIGWMPECATSEGVWQFDDGLAIFFPFEPIRLKVSDIAIEREIAAEVEASTMPVSSKNRGNRSISSDTEPHWKAKRRSVVTAALKAVSEHGAESEGSKSFWKKNGTLNLTSIARYLNDFSHRYPSLESIPANNQTYEFYYDALMKELSAERNQSVKVDQKNRTRT